MDVHNSTWGFQCLIKLVCKLLKLWLIAPATSENQVVIATGNESSAAIKSAFHKLIRTRIPDLVPTPSDMLHFILSVMRPDTKAPHLTANEVGMVVADPKVVKRDGPVVRNHLLHDAEHIVVRRQRIPWR